MKYLIQTLNESCTFALCYCVLQITFQNVQHSRLKGMPGRKPFPMQMFFSIPLALMSVSVRATAMHCVQPWPMIIGITNASYTGIPHSQTCRQYKILEIKYLKLRV